jgi:hypothetical protein
METVKDLALEAKKRMKQGFWQGCQKDIAKEKEAAKERGIADIKAQKAISNKVQKKVKGEEPDEFYLKVKAMLEEEGEVSDAIGRLTDKAYFATLSYSERQRYTLELSSRYLAAVEKYKKEKQLTV